MRATVLFAALVCLTITYHGVVGFVFEPPGVYMDAHQTYYEIMTHCEREGGECIDVDLGGPGPADTTDPPPTAPPPAPVTRPTTRPPLHPPYNIPVYDPYARQPPPLPAQRPTTRPPPPPPAHYWLPRPEPIPGVPYQRLTTRAPPPPAQYWLKPNPQPFIPQRPTTRPPLPRVQNWFEPNPQPYIKLNPQSYYPPPTQQQFIYPTPQPYFPPANPQPLPPQRPTTRAPPTWPHVTYMVSQGAAGSPTPAPGPSTQRPPGTTQVHHGQGNKVQKTVRIIHIERETPERRKRRAVGLYDPYAYLYSECRGGWEIDLGCGNRGGNVCCYPASARRRK